MNPTAVKPIGSSLGAFTIGVIFFIVLLALIGEPYANWLAAIVVLGALYVDSRVNGANDLLGTIFQPAPASTVS